MTDTELRDRLQLEGPRRMAEVRVPSAAPPLLERRVRARQIGTVVGVLATVVAVVAASVFAIRVAVRHHPPASAPTVTGPEGNRISFLYGIRVSYPRDWSLLQLTRRGNPTPLLQLSNFEPGRARSVGCDPSTQVPARGVLLVLAQGSSGAAGLSRWPVRLRPAGGSCFDARWGVRGLSFQASMIVGPDARKEDRQDMLLAYHSIRFPPALTPGVTVRSTGEPGFVVASGYVLGRPASFVARPKRVGVCLDAVVGSQPATAPCRPVRMSGTIEVLATGPWAAVVGAVSRKAKSVEAVLASGETVIGEVVRAPPLLHAAPFDFFVVELPIQSRGEVLAKDAAGNVIGTRAFDSPSLPVIAHGGVPGKRWVLIDREQSNGVRCIDFYNGFEGQGTICPSAVPAFRDVQASVMPLATGRKLVVGVASKRVAHVQVQFLNARFVPGRIIHIPKVFEEQGAVLPPIYNLFTVPIGSTEGALVVAFDGSWNSIDGLPLGTAGGFGD